MDLTLGATKDNPLLNRKELTADISFTGKTPSYPEVTDALAQKLGVAKDVVAVQHVYTAFGATKAKVLAHVYKTAEDLKKIEPKIKEKKSAAPAAKKE